MLETAVRTYDIQVVAEIRPTDDGTLVVFHNGLTATLTRDHPFHDLIVSQVEESQQYHRPVGVLVDATGRVLDLYHTYRTGVRWVRPDEDDPERMAVACWAYSPISYLTRDHPEFERIHATLWEAVTSREPVWLATHTWPVEGETEIWNKILDVRPQSK